MCENISALRTTIICNGYGTQYAPLYLHVLYSVQNSMWEYRYSRYFTPVNYSNAIVYQCEIGVFSVYPITYEANQCNCCFSTFLNIENNLPGLHITRFRIDITTELYLNKIPSNN